MSTKLPGPLAYFAGPNNHDVEAIIGPFTENANTTVTGRVSGNIPGSPVELRFIFTLAQAKITRLEIVQ